MIKQAQYMQIANEAPAEYRDLMIEDMRRKFPQIVIYKGLLYKAFGPLKMRTGISGDDFLRNLFTVVLERWLVRIPSILNPDRYSRKPKRLGRLQHNSFGKRS